MIADPESIPWYPLTKNPRSVKVLIDKLYEAWRGLDLLASCDDSSQITQLCQEFDKVISVIGHRWVRPADQTCWVFYSGSQAGKGNYASVSAFPVVCSDSEGA